jgi:hypothetical protein
VVEKKGLGAAAISMSHDLRGAHGSSDMDCVIVHRDSV